MKATKPFEACSTVGDVATFDCGNGIVAHVTIVEDEFSTHDVLSEDSDMPEELYTQEDREAFARGDRGFVGVTVVLERAGWKRNGFQGLWGIEVDWDRDNSPNLNECARDVASWAVNEVC